MPCVATITGSPREESLSTHLLDAAWEPLCTKGWDRVAFDAGHEDVAFCTGCGGCHANGICRHHDSLSRFFEKMADADALIIASPIYFRAFSAQIKRVIDRAQPYWLQQQQRAQLEETNFLKAESESHKQTDRPKRPAVLILTAGGKGLDAVFSGAETVFRCFCACFGFSSAGVLRVADTDAMTDRDLSHWLGRARELASELSR